MAEKDSRNSNNNIMLKFANIREISILGFLIIFSVIISFRNPVFISFGNLYDIALDTAILAIVAVGEMMVIITRGIDISVGAGIGLSGMIVALIIKDTYHFNPLLAIFIGVLIGAAMGALNGALIVKGNIPPIIATLGTMNIFRGLTFIINYKINGGKWVGADRLPEAFKNFARGSFLSIPNLILITIIVYLIFYYFLNHTRTGREIYAVGSSPESAKIIGINTNKTIFLTYLITGILVGMAGVLWVARYTSAQTDSATGFEFTAITAVILGGVAIAGGSGSIWGVLFGAILIGSINNSLNLIRVSPFWKLAINGAIILIAVIIDAVLARSINKALKDRKQI